ncbi:MAG TPA: pirin family protein [Gammaproteobacteria bacterium]|nr:pirin family protein [Gammaproteobacteria bacterium]
MSNPEPSPKAERLETQTASHPESVSYPAHNVDLGGDLTVERALPLRQHRLVGPWCFLDHFGPLSFSNRKVMDVAPHPHIGLQTVSWLFDGEVLHNDSLGCTGVARPGELNLMTAARAIAHAEETPTRNSGKLHGLQLWIALPDSERQRQPGFDHYKNLPVLEPGGGRVHLFMGELAGQRSQARAFSPMVGAELKFGANANMRLPLNSMWEHALVIIEGEISLDGKQLVPGALHHLGTQRSGIELGAKNPARAVLIGGAPFGESIIIWWNFVARSAEEIQAAREDWEQHRRFGEVRAYRGARLKAPSFTVRPIAGH